MQPTASLAVLIYNFAGMPFKNQVEMAWAAALVMVLMVLIINLVGQSLARRQVSYKQKNMSPAQGTTSARSQPPIPAWPRPPRTTTW